MRRAHLPRWNRIGILWALVFVVMICAFALQGQWINAQPAPATPHSSTIPPAAELPPTDESAPNRSLPNDLPAAEIPAGNPATATPTLQLDLAETHIYINEILPSPRAVSSTWGEWIELYNAGSQPVNLRGWTLSVDASSHTIPLNLIAPAGGYLLLGQRPDPAENGGVVIHYATPPLQLRDIGTITLYAPDGEIIDHVQWGQNPAALPGRSLERVDYAHSDSWRSAWRPWPGSAGDWGSPNAVNEPPPTPTPTLTRTPTPTKIPTQTRTATPSKTPTSTRTTTATPRLTPTQSITPQTTPTLVGTPLPAAWSWRADPSPLWLDEVAYRGDDEEFIVLVNRSSAPLSLAGWHLGDASWPGANEGMIALPDITLPPGGLYVIARDGAHFAAQVGRLPDLQIDASPAPIPRAVANKLLGAGSFSLSDRGDTLLLLDNNLRLADAVTFGGAGDDNDAVQLFARLSTQSRESLQRMPDAPSPQATDQRHHWQIAPWSPFVSVQYPALPSAASPPVLPGGMQALWGVLGQPTLFSGDSFHLPPQMIVQQIAARGFDFMSLGDSVHHALLNEPPHFTLLPGWRWQGVDGESALLFDNLYGGIADRWQMLPWLVQRHPVAAWLVGKPPELPEISMARVPGATLETMRPRALALWRTHGLPLLPLGDLGQSGVGEDGWITGILSNENRANGLLNAMHHARGWATTERGLYVALSAETASGRVWMGGTISPANRLRFRIDAGSDRAALTLRLWQDDRIVYEGVLNGRGAHYVDLLAPPGAWFYATAESGDAAALSAPLLVEPPHIATIRLTEVLAAPASDWNGDGSIDDGDEFVELYNPGAQPVSLAGWVLQDKAEAYDGRGQFFFTAQHVVPGGGYLVLWRDGGGPVINANDEAIFLRTPGFGMADEISWGETMTADRTLSRIGDLWHWGAIPSPGGPAHSSASLALHTPSLDRAPIEAIPPSPSLRATGAQPASAAASAAAAAETDVTGTATSMTLTGVVYDVQGNLLRLADPLHPSAAPVSILMPVNAQGHPPAAIPGEMWRVTVTSPSVDSSPLIAQHMERIIVR